MNTTKIYVIRHGETNLNAQGRLQGHVDVPLNENGKKFAQITGEALKEVPFDIIISSPLSRAIETAQLVTLPSSQYHHKKIPVLADNRLMEIDWGKWDQLGCLENNFEIPNKNFNLFYTDPFHFEAAPGGESISQVCQRTGEFWLELISQPQYRGKTILLSTHGCAVRGLLHQVYEDKSDFWQKGVPQNCSVSLVEVENQKAKLIFEDRIYYDPSLCINPYRKVDV